MVVCSQIPYGRKVKGGVTDWSGTRIGVEKSFLKAKPPQSPASTPQAQKVTISHLAGEGNPTETNKTAQWHY